MRYTQSKFSQDYKVDERYRGTNNKTRTNPGERPKQIDNNTGIAFLKRFKPFRAKRTRPTYYDHHYG